MAYKERKVTRAKGELGVLCETRSNLPEERSRSQYSADLHPSIIQTSAKLPERRGSGKTTRVIELFRARKPLMLVPTHRLAKGMRGRGVESQTYHSFFRYCGGRMVRATEVDLVKLQQTKKYEGKTITVFKAENDWKPGVEVLVAIGGTAGNLVFVARKEGGPLHRR